MVCHTLRGCVDWNKESGELHEAYKESHPSWVCGLKLKMYAIKNFKIRSHPSWVCGLKLNMETSKLLRLCHTLRGCVDWNLKGIVINLLRNVTPFVGVWIETDIDYLCKNKIFGHTLRGCVDWNISLVLLVLCLPSHTLRGCVDWN